MTIKIVKITACYECPHCFFDSEWKDIVFWNQYFCTKLERIIKSKEVIPHDCPLENAGL